MSQESVLETQSLEKGFGGVRAVAGVDFRMRRGELRCLIGPNGAGKSTFFKLVTGQLRASGGRIIFDGQEITGRAPHTIGRLGIGIKNQVPCVFEGLSVAENLWLAARLRHSMTGARVAVHEMIYRLNLGNVAKQTVGTLAHGMRQWVDIGMVMAQRPKLMLLDEPTAGMAAEEIERTVELIRVINSAASHRFSATLRPSNTLGTWFLIPIPRRPIVCGARPVISCPSKMMRPPPARS